jgi:hypothetical protein
VVVAFCKVILECREAWGEITAAFAALSCAERIDCTDDVEISISTSGSARKMVGIWPRLGNPLSKYFLGLEDELLREL